MAVDGPVISPLGWYVELPEPAESMVGRRITKKSSLEEVAGLAQAKLYLSRKGGVDSLLTRLENGDGRFRLLAGALRAELAIRHQEYDGARDLLAKLSKEPGSIGAWALLREAEVLERQGRLGLAERLLARGRIDRPDDPPLLFQIVTARLRFRGGEVMDAARALSNAADQLDDAPAPLVPVFHRAWAIYLTLLGDVPRALLHHRLALDGFRELGDQFMLAKEYLSLGQTYLEVGELDHAEFFFRKAEEAIEEMEFEQLDALLFSRLGMLALYRGDMSTARGWFEKDLDLSVRVGSLHGQAYARRNLGKVLVRLGEAESGRTYLARSVADFDVLGDSLNRELSRLEEASAMLAATGEHSMDDVARRLDVVSHFFSSIERKEMLAQVSCVKSRLRVEEGKLELARQEISDAARRLRRHRRPDRLVEALLALAELALKKKKSEAIYYLTWAYREAVAAGRMWLASAALGRLGHIDEHAVMELVGDVAARASKAHDPSFEQVEEFLLTTRSALFRQTLEEAKLVGPTEETVFVEGDTGTGKEMLARFIHAQSPRRDETFLALNCGAIHESLIEAEFFGHERGAFTGAEAQRIGVFEAANGGAVFLDEVGELSPRGQTCLLRFLEERQVRPVGASLSRSVDVRIVAATNRDLREAVREGRFRKDLYYRLVVFPIVIPTLSQRLDDLPDLVAFFLKHNPQAQKKGIKSVSQPAMKRLLQHEWPGNLRELDNVVRAASIRCKGTRILKGDLPPTVFDEPLSTDEFPTLAELTETHIAEALRRSGGNRIKAAEMLGIHRNTLAAKIKSLGSLVSDSTR